MFFLENVDFPCKNRVKLIEIRHLGLMWKPCTINSGTKEGEASDCSNTISKTISNFFGWITTGGCHGASRRIMELATGKRCSMLET